MELSTLDYAFIIVFFSIVLALIFSWLYGLNIGFLMGFVLVNGMESTFDRGPQ